jgi:hypothetical protein
MPIFEGDVGGGGGAGAGRTGTTFEGNSIFCGIGFDISKLRKLSRLILTALILWLPGTKLSVFADPPGGVAFVANSGGRCTATVCGGLGLNSAAILCKVVVLEGPTASAVFGAC